MCRESYIDGEKVINAQNVLFDLGMARCNPDLALSEEEHVRGEEVLHKFDTFDVGLLSIFITCEKLYPTFFSFFSTQNLLLRLSDKEVTQNRHPLRQGPLYVTLS